LHRPHPPNQKTAKRRKEISLFREINNSVYGMTETKDQCRDRYCTGDRISLPNLSKSTGVPLRTLQHWSAQDGWTDQRSAHDEACVAAKNAAIIAITGEDTATILERHYQAFVGLEEHGQKLLAAAEAALAALTKPVDPYKLASLSSSKNQAVSIIKSAIVGQRQARSLEYEDVNRAVAFLRKNGYVVVDSDEYAQFKLYVAQAAASAQADDYGASNHVAELFRSLTGKNPDEMPEAG
jgi:hypothetical protein